MPEYLPLGPGPTDEPCASLGITPDFARLNALELAVYEAALIARPRTAARRYAVRHSAQSARFRRLCRTDAPARYAFACHARLCETCRTRPEDLDRCGLPRAGRLWRGSGSPAASVRRGRRCDHTRSGRRASGRRWQLSLRRVRRDLAQSRTCISSCRRRGAGTLRDLRNRLSKGVNAAAMTPGRASRR